MSTLLVRAIRTAGVRLLMTVALTIGVGVVAATPASATPSTTPINLVTTTTFSPTPAVGWSTCLHKDVTLAALPAGWNYMWDEEFPQASGDGLHNYNQTFSGKFYWTVCVRSMRGIDYPNWTYYIESMMTGETSACQLQGHCTTYQLQYHYLRVDTTSKEGWGSQLQALPNTYCHYQRCDGLGTVTVTRT